MRASRPPVPLCKRLTSFIICCLDVTPCTREICHRRFGINWHTRLLVRNILNIVDTRISDNQVVSKRPVLIAKWQAVVTHVTEGQKERILLQDSKNCKLQHITVFCNYSCSVATDTFGLYCSVNRQDVKLDLASAFCYNIGCGLRVILQCNI